MWLAVCGPVQPAPSSRADHKYESRLEDLVIGCRILIEKVNVSLYTHRYDEYKKVGVEVVRDDGWPSPEREDNVRGGRAEFRVGWGYSFLQKYSLRLVHAGLQIKWAKHRQSLATWSSMYFFRHKYTILEHQCADAVDLRRQDSPLCLALKSNSMFYLCSLWETEEVHRKQKWEETAFSKCAVVQAEKLSYGIK